MPALPLFDDTERPAWYDDALCLGRHELTPMFYEGYAHHHYRTDAFLLRNAKTRAICDDCPVARQCVQWGLDHAEWRGTRGSIPGPLRREWHEEGLSARQMLERLRAPYPRRLLAKAVGSLARASLGAKPI